VTVIGMNSVSDGLRSDALPPERSTLSVAAMGRWKAWARESVNRRIFSALLTVGSLGCAVKIAATFKEIAVARQFGVSNAFDAFLTAYVLPSFAIVVVANSLNAALIPTYIQLREEEGEHASQKLLSTVMAASMALLLGVSVLLALVSPYLLRVLGSSFTAEKLALTQSLFFIMLLILPLTGVATIWTAILNATDRFALAAATPLITPLAVMLSVFLLGEQLGVYAIAYAVVAGAILECALLGGALVRRRISIAPRWGGMSGAARQILKQYTPMIAGSCMMSSTVLVDQSMAAMLGPGQVSILSYGNKMASVVVGVGSLALGTAVLPQFSRMVASSDWAGIRHTLKTYTRLVLLATILLAGLLIALARPLVSLLFERGAFLSQDVGHVASVQSLYLLQMPFYILGMLFVRLISALKANHILMWGTAINFSLNITLNYLLMKMLGVSGIALSTSLVYACSLCYLSYMALRILRKTQAE
jgi:putative peptidoglycan lipid II flippase